MNHYKIMRINYRQLLCLFVIQWCGSNNICYAYNDLGYTALGIGTMTCGEYIKANKQEDYHTIHLTNQWVNGYITAINEKDIGFFDLSEGTDSSSREQWLLKFCNENPLDRLVRATQGLIHELKSRRMGISKNPLLLYL